MQSWNTTSKTTTTTAKSMTASEDAESSISCHALTVEGDGGDGPLVLPTPGCDSYFTPGISSSAAVSVSASLRRRFRVRSSPAALAMNRRRLRPLQKNIQTSGIGLILLSNIHCVSKKLPFLFLWLLGQMLTEFKILGNIAAEKIWNLISYSFLIISSLCMNIRQ